MRALPASITLVAALAIGLSGCTGGQYACSSTSGAFSCGGQVANKSGSESFNWDNSGTRAMVAWGGQAASGSFTLSILDAAGKQVYSRNFSGTNQGGASENTATGASGTWTVRVTYSDFTGQMGLSVTGAGGSGCPPGVPYCG